MAGTVTTIESAASPLQKIVFSWLSDASGDADGASHLTYRGYLERVIFVPGAGGVQPTDNYDVVITDGVGADVLIGTGANRSNSAIQQIAAENLGLVVGDTLTIVVSNAGNAKQGVCIVYIRAV